MMGREGSFPGGPRHHRRCTTSTSPTPHTRDSTSTDDLVRPAALDAAVRRHGPPGHHDRPPAAALGRAATGAFSERQAERRNREIVRASRIEDWIPGSPATDSLPPARPGRGRTRWRCGPSGRAGRPTPRRWPSPAPAARSTRRPTGSTSPPRRQRGRCCAWAERRPGSARSTGSRERPRTYIHAFALDGDSTRYVASGRSTGPSATAGPSTSTTVTSASPSLGRPRADASADNGIVVLDERGGKLVQVGLPARPRRRRADPVGALVRRPGGPGDLPPDRPALHHRPRRPGPAETARRAEDPGLLLLPAPDRRRPPPRPRQRRRCRPASSSAPRPRSSTSPTPPAPVRSAR